MPTVLRMRLAPVMRVLLAAVLGARLIAAHGADHASANGGEAGGSQSSGRANVLVISGTDAYLPAFEAINRAMQAALDERHSRPVAFLYEATDSGRVSGDPGPTFAEYLENKYRGTRIDAVVLTTELAADLYLEHRNRLWPDAPVILHSLPAADARRVPPHPGLVVLPTNWGVLGTLRIARRLQPDARRVTVVSGISRLDQRILDAARVDLERGALGIPVEFVVGQSPRTVEVRLAQDDRRSIVLYLSMFRDEHGGVHVPRDVLTRLSAASAAPIYGIFDTFVGHGLVAGEMESFAERGERVADLLVTALARPTASALVVPATRSRCVADARQLERYGLSPGLLPDGCDLRFVERPFVERYWWQSLLVAVALVVQSVLIALLLLQRRRRRAAELSLAAQRLQLAHASRLAVAGELTASIAHEINQPLGAILANAEAAELLVQSGRLERSELLQILADIRRDDVRASEVIRRLRAMLARHDVERRRFDLHALVEETAALVRTEASRRGVAIDCALGARHAEIFGDRVQLQQVLINLVLNAFDASAASAEGARHVTIETCDTADGVRMSVRDSGPGVAAADLPRLFDSYFSTKAGGMGLGLSIARSIVDAHGGTIAAANTGGGAVFVVELPRPPSDERPGRSGRSPP